MVRLSAHCLKAAIVASISLVVVAPAHAQVPRPDMHAPPVPASPASSPTAKREPTAGDLATARTALREGLLLRERGELQEAIARLGSAFDLVPTPVTGFELGKTHMMLGHVLQAHELFKKVVRMAPSMEESTRSQVSREEAARLAKEIEPRIPSLRLRLTLPEGATAVVKVDDEIISLSGTETLRAVEPGAHEIVAQAGEGPEEKAHVEVAESETKDVTLAPKWVPPKVSPSTRSPDVIYLRQTNPLAFVGFGIAAAALVVTSVAALAYVDARDDAKSKCGDSYCPPAAGRGVLPQNAVVDTAFEGENARYNISGAIMLAAGFTTVVFVGIGIFGVTRPIKERVVSGTAIRPEIGVGRLGLSGTF